MSDSAPPIPADDPTRRLAVARPGGEDDGLERVHPGGGDYTILLAGKDTAGRFTLIDMRVPAGGGPPPHRHDFEEAFTILEGEVEFTFRGETAVLRAGETLNVPANAPHSFKNRTDGQIRMLCTCSPAGQEEYFRLATSPAAAIELAARYRTEFV